MSSHKKRTKTTILEEPRISLDKELMSYIHDVSVMLWEDKDYKKGMKKLLRCSYLEKPRLSDTYIIADAIQLVNQAYRNMEEKK